MPTKNLSITLYDLFGYLLPGMVAMVALSILVCEAAYPKPLPIYVPTYEIWIVAILVSYLLGHMVQTLWNWTLGWVDFHGRLIGGARDAKNTRSEHGPVSIEASKDRIARKTRPEEAGFSPKSVDPEIVSAASRMFEKRLGTVDPHLLFDLCDEFVVQHGNTEIREIYEYREGFYRGMTISFFLLAIALLTWLGLGSSYTFMGKVYSTPISGMLWVGVVGSLFATAAMFSRYLHFVGHRTSSVILATLTIEQKAGVSHTS